MNVGPIIKLVNDIVMFGGRTRAILFKPFFKSMGRNVVIMDHCRFYSPKGIEIGNNVFINNLCRISGPGGVSIGNDVSFGPNVNIYSSTHNFSRTDLPINQQGMTTHPVSIGDDVWLGANCVILAGVSIGKGAVIGANAVVTKDVAAYAIVGGVPAVELKRRGNEEG